MNKLGLIISYENLRDYDVAPFSINVQQRLTGNALFEITPERIAKLKKDTDDYELKLAKSQNGSRADVLLKNDAKKLLVEELGEIALDLCVQAKGDREKLATTGFPLIKEQDKTKTPPKPSNFKVEYGKNEGELIFSVKANKEARFYRFFFTPAPPAASDPQTWLSQSFTSSKNTIKGFKHGVEYACKCAYIGSGNTIVYSDTIVILAR